MHTYISVICIYNMGQLIFFGWSHKNNAYDKLRERKKERKKEVMLLRKQNSIIIIISAAVLFYLFSVDLIFFFDWICMGWNRDIFSEKRRTRQTRNLYVDGISTMKRSIDIYIYTDTHMNNIWYKLLLCLLGLLCTIQMKTNDDSNWK
jgi:hypothetical protein